MTTTATATCPSWCVEHTDYSDDEHLGRVEHQSEPFPWSRKRGYVVELLQLDNGRPGLHITAGDDEMDTENVTPDDILNLMRRLAEILAAWQSEASR